MQIIGFNFTKIHGEKAENFSKPTVSTNITFKNVEKEKISLLKEQDSLKINFEYRVDYDSSEKSKKKESQGSISIEGTIVLTATKEQIKEIQKSWKKQKLPPHFQVPIYNLILKKCSPKAISLEDDITLPVHLPLPQLRPVKKQE
jgi:hypothetical protein